jgi:hypothetical protein
MLRKRVHKILFYGHVIKIWVWFGHEKMKLKKGVPVVWEIRRLGDIIELAYGKALKEADRTFGDFPVYGSGGVIGTHNKSLVKGPGIIVGRNLTPSKNDIAITRQLKSAGEILGIRLLDHIIFSHKGYYSFLENGELE